ncbi:MAG: acetamidase/formamidase family protein [Ktedonobacteraceae bacterium]|nr:acetamidase/formamidase family protein [Ktedonobacteraceae bacterium]MBO0790801.1 acetamidase/formamidase family protein [Ktedonobacteraceae bacterium]
MAIHVLPLERRTLHGQFSRDIAPVLTIDSGDSVHFTTLDAGWNVAPGKKYELRDNDLDRGHALCGPIAIRGAEPGMTLEVRINQLRPVSWGWTRAGGWSSPVNDRLGVAQGETLTLDWALDHENGTARDQFGHTVKLCPFLGVMGMPPSEPGSHPTAPPRTTGGNIDCKELVVGSSLFLPIAVPLGLFSTGDGHAVQGDGEVSTTALECGMELADLTFLLHKDMHLTTPRALTPAGRITFGFHQDLHEATMIALDAMLEWMGELHGLPRLNALALASLAVDLHVTQLVNAGVRGAHAILSYDAIGGV